MTGIATAMDAEPEITGEVAPSRKPRGPAEPCPECGAKRHSSDSTCSRASRRSEGRRARSDFAPRRQPLKPQKVAQNIGVCLVLGQTGLFTLKPQWAEDQLSPDELGQLSYALADELLTHERIVKWIEKVSGAGVHIRLAMVLVAIAIPRMVRHGMLPAELAMGMFGAMVQSEVPASSNGAQSERPSPDEQPVITEIAELEMAAPPRRKRA